jgi:hypothetical protein
VASGLQPGAIVVVDAPQLRDGTVVKTKPYAADASSQRGSGSDLQPNRDADVSSPAGSEKTSAGNQKIRRSTEGTSTGRAR